MNDNQISERRTGGGRIPGRSAELGSPFAPHTADEVDAMLETVGVDDVEELFDVPEAVAFDGSLDIDAHSERTIRREVRETLSRNADLVEFLGRDHYDHYVPAAVDDLSGRAEFLTSYTQYQPEITQGFLQALFEYQSLVVELTGLAVANCSMYDAATALGEAALLAERVRDATGSTILIPDHLRDEKRAVLANYVAGAGLEIDTYPMDDGNVDCEHLAERVDADTLFVYAENPTVRGAIEEQLTTVGDIAHEADALFCVGSDLIAMALLESPRSVGADVVVGDASVLGLPASDGMGLGVFAVREQYLRSTPGRLVGAGRDAEDRRAYTLTLQTREQHIRKERATSNICTNQAWVALRAAMHATALGPEGLAELADQCVREAHDLAAQLDAIDGVVAPVHDRHHFREFAFRTDRPAAAVATALRDRGFAVHALGEHLLQACVTETTADAAADLVAAVSEVTQ